MVESLFLNAGIPQAQANSVAKALVKAEIDGQKGHGFSRIPSYLAQVQSGKVNRAAEIKVTKPQPAVLSIDADFGFAFPAIDAAINLVPELAAEYGLAAAGIFNSHHAGQMGAHVERLAEAGFLAIMMANTPKAMAPWGGSDPLFGTNPIAFAAPRSGSPPLVVDLSLSKVARGKIMAAAQNGETIPEGWALDENGLPTTDPKSALNGSMVPMGDAKGAALALMVEVIAACLTGANFSYEASSFFDANGEPPSVGQFILVIRTDANTSTHFAQRLQELVAEITRQEGARLPGERRIYSRNEAFVNGLTFSKELIQKYFL